MKILWHSVAPWVGSGYGQQTARFVPRIRDLGHDIAISAYYGLMGAKTTWRGVPVLPAWAAPYGADTIVPHAVWHFGGGEPDLTFRDVADRGLIITLGDVWTLQQPLLREVNTAAWVPIDHETIPMQVAGWFEMTGAIPIAMSRFGQRLLSEAGLDPLYVPHGVDTSVFFPGDKAEARERTGLPQDAFVIAMVAANVGKDGARKAFSEQIVAFAELRKRHSDAMLVLHTDVTNPLGVDILHLLSDFPRDSYMTTDQYAYRVGVPDATVADIYRAADVLTNCSWGEGFGVPIVEAQACGTPVVVTDTTAMPELVGAGWKVPTDPFWHDSARAWMARPLVSGIAAAYEQAYEHARDEDMRAQAWAFAQDYDVERVLAEHWVPALGRLEEALRARRDDPRKEHRLPSSDRLPATLRQPDQEQPEPDEQIYRVDGLLWLDRGPGYGDWLGWQAHEEPLKPIITGLLPDGGVFLDVGAHIGHWALRLAGKASQVYAVEAAPATAAVLRRHIAMNGLTNVEVVELAAWDEPATLVLDNPGDEIDSGSTRTLPKDGADPSNGVAVSAARLDDVLSLDRLDLVKLDVEGADLHALRGMAGLLDKHRPALFIECHDAYGYYERADLESLLAELGYSWEVAFWYGTRWHPDGMRLQPVRADYLVCKPVERDQP